MNKPMILWSRFLDKLVHRVGVGLWWVESWKDRKGMPYTVIMLKNPPNAEESTHFSADSASKVL